MLIQRLRRNRKSGSIRELLTETRLNPADFVAPLYVVEGSQEKQQVPSFPGVYRYSIDFLVQECRHLADQGITSVLLFPSFPKEKKDPFGTLAFDPENVLHVALQTLKSHLPEMTLMVDIALDTYTDHGHDGLIDERGYVLNDPTVESLSKLSVSLARAGADIVAPSDMMDGRVSAIRRALEQEGFTDVSILAYAAKYCSSFYAPFRGAVQSSLSLGDKKNYQLNPANIREALLEAELDEREGADMLLVKPALHYLDVLVKIKAATHLPVGAYHVSGEYAMLQAAAKMGYLNYDQALFESMISIKRAGADFIITNSAAEIASKL